MEDDTKRLLKVTGITAAAVVVVGTVAALLVRDQISRQRRNLFNPLAIRRMAASRVSSPRRWSPDPVPRATVSGPAT